MSETAVETEGLVKRYGDTVAVDGVSLRVEPGAVRGLLGRNGAGKTTLLRILFGLLPPDGGRVRLFGRDAGPADVEAREGVGGFVEEPRFYPYLTARRNLELLARLDGRPGAARADELLERVGLQSSRDVEVGNYSTGMRQRLGLAAALLREPRLLLLDEPTIGLDPAGARDVRTLIAELAGGRGDRLPVEPQHGRGRRGLRRRGRDPPRRGGLGRIARAAAQRGAGGVPPGVDQRRRPGPRAGHGPCRAGDLDRRRGPHDPGRGDRPGRLRAGPRRPPASRSAASSPRCRRSRRCSRALTGEEDGG